MRGCAVVATTANVQKLERKVPLQRCNAGLPLEQRGFDNDGYDARKEMNARLDQEHQSVEFLLLLRCNAAMVCAAVNLSR
jgi:hypothetical protein